MALAALKQELEIWDRALQAFDSKDYEAALSTFESFSDTSRIVANIGLIYEAQGKYELAIESFSEAINLDKYMAMAYFERGVCRLHLKDVEQAVQDFSEAEIRLRGNAQINYEELGLSFVLYAAEIQFNRAKALIQSGHQEEGLTFLRRAISSCSGESHSRIKDVTVDSIKDIDPFAIPEGIVFRPSPSKRKFLQEYEVSALQALKTNIKETNIKETHPSPPSPRVSERAKSDVSSTCAPSSGSSIPSNKKSFRSFSAALSSSSSAHPLRSDLNKVMGSDLLVPSTEISTIPCAGVRIPYGKLSGLMAWRFVVQLDDSSDASRRQKQKQKDWDKVSRPSIITNFILDTGSANSHIPQETLRALGYKGSYKAGTEVSVRVQGVSTKCVIARYGEAGRLGGQFMTSGSLTFYFDTKLNAPILYVGDANDRPTDIPRTVTIDPQRKSRRVSLRESVYSIMASLHLIRAAETPVSS